MKAKQKKNAEERREDILRPSKYLGYDRDFLGIYLFSRGAYKIAELQFRRAVWLNPFEPQFKQHLALCLYEEKRYAEAQKCILEALEQEPQNTKSKELLDRINKIIVTQPAK